MIRTIVLLAVVLLAQPLMAQQEAINPYKIVLGQSTIAALKSNPKGLVWAFDSLGANPHDGVTVYYDPSESLVSQWKVNDGTMQNLFSLDVSDEILQQIENDYGLPALISPSDRERIRGVLLRYTPATGGALPPSSSIGPIAGAANTPAPLVPSNPPVSILDNNRVTTNLENGSQNLRPLGNSPALGGGSMLPTTGNEFYQNRPAPLQPQSNDFALNRPATSSGTASYNSTAIQPIPQQPLNTPDRYASNQAPLLPPPVYNNQAAAAPQNHWTAAHQEPLVPNRRPVQPQFPQVSYNPYADNQYQGVGQAVLPPPPTGAQIATGNAGQAGTQAALPANWQSEKQILLADLAESKQRSVFLLFMLFLLAGLCLYLSWLARGFYFRYAELADELRETFSATT
jgi:hypothetical protein